MGIFNKNKNKEDKPKKDKKKFKDTGVGKFLKEKGPDILGGALELVGDITGRDVLENIGKKIKGSDELSAADKERALELLELDLEAYKVEVEDRKSARSMYSEKNSKADDIASKIIIWNLPVMGGLLAIEIACIIYMKSHPEVLAIISAAVGGVIQSLISERLTVIQFFFGSSMGSKRKQAHIDDNKIK